jgi:lysophospholipase L1-like esterase
MALGKMGVGFGRLGGLGKAAGAIVVPPFAPTSNASFDFPNGLYTGGSLGSMLTFSRAAPATTYAADTSGNLSSFAANAPRITNRGLLIEPAATNVTLASIDLSSWITGNSSITAGQSDPSGGTGAVLWNEGATAAVSHSLSTFSGAGGTVTSGSTYTASVYVKPVNKFRFQLSYGSAIMSGSGYANFNLDPAFLGDRITGSGGTQVGSGWEKLSNGWWRIWFTATATASGNTAWFIAGIGTAGATRALAYNGASQTAYIWGGQTEAVVNAASSRPTSLIPTVAAAVTRSADAVTFAGAAAALLASGTGSLLMGTDGLNTNTSAITLVDANGSILLGKTAANLLTDNLVAGLSSGNTGLWSLRNKSFVSWSPSGRSLTLNDNVAVTDASAMTPAATFTLISTISGYLSKMALWSSVQLNSVVTLPFDGTATAWGDSLTFGNQDLTAVTYPNILASSYGFRGLRTVTNQGVSGNTSSQILTRFSAASTTWNQLTLIWSGRNNYTAPSQVQSDIAAMVAALTTNQYIVMSIINMEDATEYAGQANYNTLIALNAALASTYGTRYLDIRSILVAAYNPANPVDVIDHGNDIPPYSLRSNTLNGTIVTATVNPGDTAFTVSVSGLTPDYILLIGTEYIYITGVTGTSVTSCVRGYAGTTPGTYPVTTTWAGTEKIHLGQAGYNVVAAAVKAKLTAIGPW